MLAGESLVAGKFPGERIATQIETTDSAIFTTTEVTVISVTASLVQGRTYRVSFRGMVSSTVGTDDLSMRMREDNSTGTQLGFDIRIDINNSTTSGVKSLIEAEYTALVTGNKTFVVTGDRTVGTGDGRLEAAADHPAYLYVDYIRG